MKKETAIKRTFKRMEREYPLLRKSLRAFFVEIIILTYEGFQLDEDFDDMNDSEKLDYSYEINTCDEYHQMINEFNTYNESQVQEYSDLWDSYFLMCCGR